METVFIINPAAGKGKAKSLSTSIENVCSRLGAGYIIEYTDKPNAATAIARDYALRGAERVVSVGGDGTLNEVVNGLIGTDAALGVLPGGTGNDFIKSINSHTNIEEIIYDNIYGSIIDMDLGKCNGKYFINIGSLGLDSEVVITTESVKKFFSGSAAYSLAIIKTLFSYKGYYVTVNIDDKISFESDMLMTAVANGKYYGGGFLPAPDADLSDGLFNISFCKHTSLMRILKLLPAYQKGTHTGAREFSFYTGKRVKFQSPHKIAINIDGEVFTDKEVEFEMVEKGIKVIVPFLSR